jgi:hypothetical protein
MTQELPVTDVSDSVRTLKSATSVARSVFTLSAQTQDWGGRVWLFTINFTSRKGDGARRLAAFFHRNGHKAGSFIFRCPTMVRPNMISLPLVQGSGQTGASLVTNGWVANELKAGDFISIGSGASTRLYSVQEDVTHTAGTATINIYPPLRSSPPNNAPVEIRTPGVLLRALEDVPTAINTAMFHQFSIECEEAT